MDISFNPITQCTPRRNTSNIELCMKSKKSAQSHKVNQAMGLTSNKQIIKHRIAA
jgi:hypothetical protein